MLTPSSSINLDWPPLILASNSNFQVVYYNFSFIIIIIIIVVIDLNRDILKCNFYL